jgi:hypothetical protein
MATGATPDEVLRRVVAALDDAGVPYMVTGSLASSLHGAPRSTQDIDVVVAPDRESLERLLDSFPASEYYVSRNSALTALRESSMFNVIDHASGWKIDFIIRKAREFSRREFDRRIRTSALGMALYVATPEDVVIAKLEWAKRSGSERQVEDAAAIIRTQGDLLDTTYVEPWIEMLEIRAQWEDARTRAKGSGGDPE